MLKRKWIIIKFGVIIGSVLLLTFMYHKIGSFKGRARIPFEIHETLSLKPEETQPPEVEYKIVFPEQIKVIEETSILVESAQDRAKEIEVLIDKLQSSYFQTAQQAEDELTNLGEYAVPELVKRLPDASIALKGQIVFILGRIGDKNATFSLIETLKDENAYIRRNSAIALGKIKDERALFNLGMALFDDDVSVRQCSAWALGELGDSGGVEGLLERLTEERQERVKIAMVDALGKLKDQRATSPLLEELKSKNNQLYKNVVVTALGDIGDSRALKELIVHVNNLKNKLKQCDSTEKMIIFQLEQAIKIAEDAIMKIQKIVSE